MATMEKKFNVSDEDVTKLIEVFANLNTRDIWSRVKKEDFTVKRFSMGFVNDIACCELTPEARKRLCRSPQDLPAIVVKYVLKEMFFKLPRPEIVACNMLLSEHRLTPRLSYISDEVAINEYIPSRNYKQEDDLEPETVKQLARVIARVHSLNVPISMDGFREFSQMFGEDFDKKMDEDPMFADLKNKKYLEHLAQEEAEIRDKYYSTLEEIDMKASAAFTLKLTKAVNSPLVFSHNDFNRGNRIVQEVKDKEGKTTTSKQIYLVDFDYSTMNYRGYDLGRYFSNYRHEDDMFGDEGFPTDEEMALFLEEYRAECGRIQGDWFLEQEENSLEQLIKESKVFTLQACGDYFFCLMMYTNDPKGFKKDYFLQSAFSRYNAYKKNVKLFTDDGTIPALLKGQTNGVNGA